jgi:hypothetical protein
MTCVHYFIIPPPSGPGKYIGKCKKCHATRSFQNAEILTGFGGYAGHHKKPSIKRNLIIKTFKANPDISAEDLAITVNVSRAFVYTILNKEKLDYKRRPHRLPRRKP